MKKTSSDKVFAVSDRIVATILRGEVSLMATNKAKQKSGIINTKNIWLKFSARNLPYKSAIAAANKKAPDKV